MTKKLRMPELSMEQKELLQKLRATPACKLCAEAANEIERLQAAWDAAFRQAVSNGEEIQWLRAGMRDIAETTARCCMESGMFDMALAIEAAAERAFSHATT